MASPARAYQQEIHRNLGFFATWLPGDDLSIGDVGTIEDGRFRYATSLVKLGIPFDIKQGPSTRDLQYTSASGTQVSVNGGAAVQGVAKGSIKLDFSANGAFVFYVSGLKDQRLADLHSVSSGIIDAYRKNAWNKDWVLVDSVHTADIATIVVSQDSNASLELEASVQGSLSALSLADPKASLSVTSTRGKLVHVVAGKNTRPLYLCVRLKDSFFRNPRVEPVRGAASAAAAATSGSAIDATERPGLDELLG